MSYYEVAFVIALLVFEDHILVGKADKSAENYKRFQDSCYYFSDDTATREEAAQECKPGHLADVTSAEEHVFIVNELSDNMVEDAWFGLLKSLSWSDGSSLVHESWQEILADDNELCFQLWQFGNYLWNDIGCDEQLNSICEYEILDRGECRPGFAHFESSCYQIYNNTLTRSEAAAACNTSHLADITSNAEQGFVAGLLKKSGGGDAWFGLTYSDPPSWSDGSLLSPGSWYDIITDGGSICYRLRDKGTGGDGYSWEDSLSTSCKDTYNYVCEYKVGLTRECQQLTTPSTYTVKISTTVTSTTSKAISYPLQTAKTELKGVVTEASTFISTSTSNSTTVLAIRQKNVTGATVGSLFGVAVLIAAIAAVIWFVLRHKKRSNPESPSQDKVSTVNAGTTSEPEHSNPTYAIDTEAATDDYSHQYHTVHDQTGEYTYIETNASGKCDEHIYAETAADRKSSHTSNKDSHDVGWKDNTIYATSDEATQNTEEGWADNSVYGK